MQREENLMTTQMMQPTQTLQKQVKADKKISLTKIMVSTDSFVYSLFRGHGSGRSKNCHAARVRYSLCSSPTGVQS